MPAAESAPPHQSEQPELSRSTITLIAVACGVMVASIYYAQTLIDLIAPQIGIATWMAGIIVTLTQLGYGVGLALIVPLSDLFENRRLALAVVIGGVIGNIGLALSTGPVSFLAASLLTGLCAVGAQVLIPLAAHLAPPDKQGHTVGLAMSGLLAGIMLARPLSSYVAEIAGWRAIFVISAVMTAMIGVALVLKLPERHPRASIGYGAILRSMFGLFIRYRQLRLRAAYQALMFAAFNLFWTAAPLVLIRKFGFSYDAVALFALLGAGGALAAPIAGRLADRGLTRVATAGAMLVLALSFLAADWAVAANAVIAFGLTALLIDAAVQINQITGQKIIFGLSSEARGRVNATYMTIMFLFGATGSLIGSASYAAGGWQLVALIGAGLGATGLAVFALFERGHATTSAPPPR